MTNFKISRSTIIATAFIALGALSISGLSAKADITGRLSQCKALTVAKVIRCCDQVVRTDGRPLWMIDTHNSCRSSVSCVSSTTGKGRSRKISICTVRATFKDGGGNSTPKPPGTSNNPSTPGITGTPAFVKG